MTAYIYEAREGDWLKIGPSASRSNTATVAAKRGVYLPAAEAPKAAQALLDAAGVKGVLLTDLPEVVKVENGNYATSGFTSYHQSDLSKLEKEAKALTAIWLRHKADTADKERQVADARAAENKAAAAKKAHDDLRTSPIALKALAIYNRGLIGIGPYETWDAINEGYGASDELVHYYIRRAEQEEAKEKEAFEKLAARRDALAVEHFEGVYAYLPREGYRKAVDRIIELEDKAA